MLMQTVLRACKPGRAWIYGFLSMIFLFSSVVSWGQTTIASQISKLNTYYPNG